MEKNLALIAKYFKKLYKPTNNNLRTSSRTPKQEIGYYSKSIRSYNVRFIEQFWESEDRDRVPRARET
ncbi:hypothetical protein Tco_0116008 [Tanacetum coccineum]